MSDVRVLTSDSQIHLEIDCTGCLNEETLSIETFDKINENERITRQLILGYDILSDIYKRERYINAKESKCWWKHLKIFS